MIEEENKTFGSFGKSFQESLAKLILEDSKFASQIGEVLDMNFFELRYLQDFVKKIYSYRTDYTTHPSRDTFESILKNESNGVSSAVRKQVRDFYVRMVSGRCGDVDEEYVKSNSLDFCRKQKLQEAMLQSVKLMQDSSFDEISKIINDALKLGLCTDFGYDFIEDFEQRYQLISRGPISTGWAEIDRILNGGLGSGELGVVIAPTGVGKSMVLSHLGTKAIQAGKTVVHYTLELQDVSVGNRYDSCITGIRLNELFQRKDEVLEEIREVPGKLLIKEYPTKSATTQTIRTHLDKLRQRDIEIGMVIVDYADILKPISFSKEKRNDLETIYEELRGIAQEYECPVWTASQTNRSGINAEVITMESISEAFSKCFVADFIFSVSRKVEDKMNNTGRLFIAKNRNGIDGVVYPIFMDAANVDIKVLPQKISLSSNGEDLSPIQERYKSWRDSQSPQTPQT